MTRQEHLQWCKDRALAYVDAGDLTSALSSMLSDMGKHPETEKSLAATAPLGMMLQIGGHLSRPEQMRDFINGFN